MKKHNSVFLAFSFLLLLSACQNGSVKSSDHIRIEGASDLGEQSFRFERLEGNVLVEDMPGNAVRISRIDSLLFLVDMNADKLIHIYSIPNTRFLGDFGSRGRGPNELLSVIRVREGSEKGKAGIYDVTQRQWFEFSVPDMLQTGRLVVESTKSTSTEDGAHYITEPILINENEFVTTDFLGYESRCFRTDWALDSYLNFVNPQISFKKNFPDVILADMYSSNLNVRPDRSRLVLAGRYIDLVEIFDIDGTHIFTGIGPRADLDIEIDLQRSAEREAFMKTDETRRAFLSVKSTDEYIYLLYSGKQQQDSSNYSSGSSVYVVDWNGKPVSHLELDAPIWDFEISDDNKILWGLQPLPLPSLVQYDLGVL